LTTHATSGAPVDRHAPEYRFGRGRSRHIAAGNETVAAFLDHCQQFGAGLSLALLDARTLFEQLSGDVDFAQAARRYERERTQYYEKLLRLESWGGRILYGVACPDDAPLLAKLPRLRELGVDIIGAGPYCRIDDDTERQLFGEVRAV
jgi:2-polyprenyl-6-methoxyphenol hydroxylase-like FAD-dependent oxidoreductase